MSKLRLTSSLLLCLCFNVGYSQCNTSIWPGDLVITEVLYNSQNGDPEGEWFEIYNASDSLINLKGMEISDGSNKQIIVDDVIINKHEYLTIGASDPNFFTNQCFEPDYIFNGFGFSDSGEMILLNCNGLIDEIDYTTIINCGRGFAIQLDPRFLDAGLNNTAKNWCLSFIQCDDLDFGTPGLANELCPRSLEAGDLVLTEINVISSPNRDWVEIVNTSQDYISLTGSVFSNGDVFTTVQECDNVVIPPCSYIVAADARLGELIFQDQPVRHVFDFDFPLVSRAGSFSISHPGLPEPLINLDWTDSNVDGVPFVSQESLVFIQGSGWQDNSGNASPGSGPSFCLPIEECIDLICKTTLSVSLDQTCQAVLTEDVLVENLTNSNYEIGLFTTTGQFIRNSVITGFEAGDSLLYRIKCSDNSCEGLIYVEPNSSPLFAAPCAVDETGIIPDDCMILCTPSGNGPPDLLSIEDVRQVYENCGIQFIGDIKVDETRDNTLCDTLDEIVTLSYIAKLQVSDRVEEKVILNQRYSIRKLDLTTDIRFPDDVRLNCNYNDTDFADGTPESIFPDEGADESYPYFVDFFDQEVDVKRIRDTVRVLVNEIEREILVKDTIDGREFWITKTVVDKIFDNRITITLDSSDFDPKEVPLVETICNIQSSYTDVTTQLCGNSFKILRTWEILDWCSSTLTRSSVQTIDIVDTSSPRLDFRFSDISVGVAPWECTASLRLPGIDEDDVSDNCDRNSELTVEWIVEDGIVNGRDVTQLSFTKDLVKATVRFTDRCDNTSTRSLRIRIVDDLKPAALCIRDIRLGVSGPSSGNPEGYTVIHASDFDAGSHDSGCGGVILKVVREDDWEDIELDCNRDFIGYNPVSCRPFTRAVDDGVRNDKGDCIYNEEDIEILTVAGDYVVFCCEDIGERINVILFVEDKAGNINQCIARVEVDENTSPVIVCDDISISCSNADQLREPAVIVGSCTDENTIEVQLRNETINDNVCDGGLLIREWYIDVNSNNDYDPTEPTCIQNIRINAEETFDPLTIKWPANFQGIELDGILLECLDDRSRETDSKITLPDALNCMPSHFDQKPEWCVTDCGLVGTSFSTDTLFTQGNCLKIIKHWTILDWCTFTPNEPQNSTGDDFELVQEINYTECASCTIAGQLDSSIYVRYKEVAEDGIYEYDQIIEVRDEQAPTLFVDSIYIVEIPTTEKSDNSICHERVSISASASDFCMGTQGMNNNLKWQVRISNQANQEEQVQLVGDSVTLSNIYGVAGQDVMINWEINDICGNRATKRTIVRFADVTAPSALCLAEISTSVSSQNGIITLSAQSFDAGSFDNCSSTDQLIFAVTTNDSTFLSPEDFIIEDFQHLNINCSTVESYENLMLWVKDEAGNSSSCSFSLKLSHDCDQAVESNSSISIKGSVQSIDLKPIEDVSVQLSSSIPEYPKFTTSSDLGQYSFFNNPANQNYNIHASKEEPYVHGLSTLDLILMTRHILGIAPFESPYSIISADGNGDYAVSVADIILFRRLIIGDIDSLPDINSWQFIDASHVFLEPNNPWPFSEIISINEGDPIKESYDFIGIKVGDANHSLQSDNVQKATNRYHESVDLRVIDQVVYANQKLTVAFKIEAQHSLFGMQFKLEHPGLELTSIASSTLSEDDYLYRTNEFTSLFTLHKATPLDHDGELILNMQFNVLHDLKLSESLQIDEHGIHAEAYIGETLEEFDVNLQFEDQLTPKVNQNYPNPFSDQSTIDIFLPSDSDIDVLFYDQSGQLMHRYSVHRTAGKHNLIIDNSQFTESGIYFYSILIGERTFSYKMLVLKG